MQLGCAKPNYVPSTQEQTREQQSNQEKNSGKCTVQFKNSGVCLDWSWEKIPSETETGSFSFKTYRLENAQAMPVFVDLQFTPKVVLWMPSMSHGSSPVRTQIEGVGKYKALDVFFIMPGEWEIKFQIKDGNQIYDEAIVSTTI